MKHKEYIHPAFSESLTDRQLNGIVNHTTFSSKAVQIIDLTCKKESCVVFIPRKIFSDDIAQGSCLRIHGEDHHKDYYGDIFIANHVSRQMPTADIFFLYSIHHFHLFSRFQLEKIIDSDQSSFVDAIKNVDIEYVMRVTRVTTYTAKKFIEFCQTHLSQDRTDEAF